MAKVIPLRSKSLTNLQSLAAPAHPQPYTRVKVPYFDVIFNEASWGAEQQTHGKLLSRATPGGGCLGMGSISVFPLSKCHLKMAIVLLFYGIPDCKEKIHTYKALFSMGLHVRIVYAPDHCCVVVNATVDSVV